MSLFRASIAYLLLAGSALATPAAGVRCVQDQLNASGFDAGVADGQIGGRTRAALATFSAETGFRAGRAFEKGTAVAFCRQIGLAQPELKAFWPSRTATLEVVAEPGISPAILAIITSRSPKIHAEAASRLGLELAGADRVVVGTSASSLRRMISEQIDYRILDLDQDLQEDCASSRNLSGGTAPGIVWVCGNPEARLASGIEYDWLEFFLAHEILHLIQFQVSGTVEPNASTGEALRDEGPVWLQEGLAQVFANTVATDATEAEYRDIMESRFEGSALPDLSGLEDRPALARDQNTVYRAGAIGASDLVIEHGYLPFGQFYESLGEGSPWDQAFDQAFGVPPDVFYQSYRNRFRD